MNVALWICAGVLAAVALVGGLTKTFVPRAKLAATPGGAWTGHVDARAIKGLGVLEIFAAVGLILPAVLNIAPVMVPITAVCWVLLMVGAMTTHLRLGERMAVAANVIYLAVAVFVAWGGFAHQAFGA
ncbi:DoxX family protein [Nocardia sp. NBC_00511]|uniref:DoxX family protein n=1 Tax=Nocardia sp. NBC_00511 TaxID=2903591 RepID=UPI0030DFA60E